MFLKSVYQCIFLCGLALTGSAYAEELKSFQPFEISVNKLTSTTLTPGNSQTFYRNSMGINTSEFDFLAPQKNGYHMSTQSNGVFGEELVVGMKFADWLTLRLNVIDEDQSYDLFSGNSLYNRTNQSDNDLLGYQLGISSVLNITNKWRFGIDLGMGRVGGELMGLYQDRQIETTRLGFGIRNNKFGATFQSDFMNDTTQSQLDQSTMDLQVDWHFTKDGTISFGARRNVRENTANGTSLDELTGTVPYIKFKHNL